MTNFTHLKTSVCILGCGPSGIVLGNIMLNNGIDCIILDKYNREEIYARGRAGVIEITTVQQLKKHHLAEPILNNAYTHGTCEFRSPEKSITFEYASLTGGDVHYVYPQSDLNDDLISMYLERGGKLLFHHEGKKIVQNDDNVEIKCDDIDAEKPVTIQADFVAGCDGYHGIARQSIPPEAVETYTKEYNYCWLAILAYAPPSAQHPLYGVHPDGFSGHMLRNSKISRYYLQISNNDTLEDWSDDRIWANLRKRLAKKGWKLNEGEIFQKRTMELRNYVMEPMRYRRLFMAGDAAHIITPMGGKGLNLAVQDAVVLAETLIRYYQENPDSSYLDRYSQIRLPYIWRAQAFSYSMLTMLHAPEGEDLEDVRFRLKLSQSKLEQLATASAFAKDFARNYVGIV
ncbi:MAG: 4-hydroxybenzoate 3-monooxygenase [Symploca sp. SIO2E6]|nr:4-hydroxybenzoate 3-monooxygenase [Symploca sp. SIO2E6]